MSEQLITNPATLTWRSNSASRGYDQSGDRIVVPLAPQVEYFSAQQLDLMTAQLEVLGDPVDFVASIGRTSLKRVGVRTVWEETNLRGMNVLPRLGDDLLVKEYAELAGNPERIGDLLQWFAQYSATLDSAENTVLGNNGTVQNEEFIGERADLKPGDVPKGFATEVGTAMQHGNWDQSIFLEEAMKKGLDAARSWYSITRWETPSTLRPGRHKITEIYDDSGISFDVVRERPYADLHDGSLHVIKRSAARVIPNYAAVSSDEIRDVLNFLAQIQSPENTSKDVPLTPGAQRVMRHYLRIIHEHPKPDKNAPYVVIPDSMSFIFRRPPKKV